MGKYLSEISIIVDKGFYSSINIADLDDLGVNYIIPLKSDNSQIDYIPAIVEHLCEAEDSFRNHGRTIFAYTQDVDSNHNITLCVDIDDREIETKTFGSVPFDSYETSVVDVF